MANHTLAAERARGRPLWATAAWAGFAAGLIFLVLEVLMLWAFLGVSPWTPVRMIGAILLGTGALSPIATFDLGVTVAALAVHFVLSVVYGLIIGLLVFRLKTNAALAVGLGVGLVIYLVNFYGFTAVFPWFAEVRNWITILAHLAFGLAAAWIYKSRASTIYDRKERRLVERDTGHPPGGGAA